MTSTPVLNPSAPAAMPAARRACMPTCAVVSIAIELTAMYGPATPATSAWSSTRGTLQMMPPPMFESSIVIDGVTVALPLACAGHGPAVTHVDGSVVVLGFTSIDALIDAERST